MDYDYEIKILLLDKDLDFAVLLKNILKEKSNGIRFTLDFASDFLSSMSLIDNNWDVYFCSASLLDSKEKITMLKEWTNKVNSELFIISNHDDKVLLKNIVNIGISGYINKNEMEIESLIEKIKKKISQKIKMNRIKEKIEYLMSDTKLKAI